MEMDVRKIWENLRFGVRKEIRVRFGGYWEKQDERFKAERRMIWVAISMIFVTRWAGDCTGILTAVASWKSVGVMIRCLVIAARTITALLSKRSQWSENQS
jgi:hypothetical protein